MGGLVQAVFDPAGLFGNWDEGSAPVDTTPSFFNTQKPAQAIGQVADAVKKSESGFGNDGFLASMTAPAGGAAAQAFSPDAKIKPADWSAQWRYEPGKGPQWIEPKRVSSDNDVPYAAVVNNGPVKGNRI